MFQQGDVQHGIAIGKVHAVHAETTQHLLDLPLIGNQFTDHPHPSIDDLHRRADHVRADALRKRSDEGFEDTARDMHLRTCLTVFEQSSHHILTALLP